MKITITRQIEETAFRLLRENPDGIKWSQLNKMIEESNPSFHPKTINGVAWKLPQKFPDKVTKDKGVFRIID